MARARLTKQALATADAGGIATFIFEPPPPGLAWTGTIGVVGAPAGAVSSAEVGSAGGGFPWGSWAGNGTFGPVQAFGREVLRVVTSGLTPGTAYSATWIGVAEREEDAGPASPTALATSIASTSAGAVTQLVVPASAFAAVVGAPALGPVASPWAAVMLMAPGVDEVVQAFAGFVPGDWATADVDLWWTNAGAGAGNVRWVYNPASYIEGDNLTGSAGGISQVVGAPAQNVIEITRMTTGASVSPASLLSANIRRSGSSLGVDTLANDAGIIAVVFNKAS